MGFTTNLLTGIGELLDAENVGAWGGPFAPTDTAIVIDSLGATPDKGIALTLYDVEHTAGTDSVMGLQCRVRGNPKDRTAAKDILDRLLDTLHDLEAVTIGGVPIVRIWWQSGANLGPDALNRPEHTANYYLQITRTGTHRED
jgi:hypothetical protein